jgi:predicted amidophosphoribosyltransferase
MSLRLPSTPLPSPSPSPTPTPRCSHRGPPVLTRRQICQFCYNNIKTTMNGLCPACRRPYDDSTIEFKNITPEEWVPLRCACPTDPP